MNEHHVLAAECMRASDGCDMSSIKQPNDSELSCEDAQRLRLLQFFVMPPLSDRDRPSTADGVAGAPRPKPVGHRK
jgi:hypothetical protein